MNTTFTNTTCLAVHLTPDALCDFSIQTSVCEIAGDRSDSVFITLPSGMLCYTYNNLYYSN